MSRKQRWDTGTERREGESCLAGSLSQPKEKYLPDPMHRRLGALVPHVEHSSMLLFLLVAPNDARAWELLQGNKAWVSVQARAN